MSLSVFLVRNGQPDDTIRVLRVRDGGFRVHYYDGESRVRYTRTMTPNELQWYFAVTLSMLTTDIMPFRHVQVSAPGYPSVMYAVGDLETNGSGWTQFTQVVGQFIQGPPWVTEFEDGAPSEPSDGTSDEDDGDTEPVTPRFGGWWAP